MFMPRAKLAAVIVSVVSAIVTGAGLAGQELARQAGKPDLREGVAVVAQASPLASPARQAGKPDLREIAARADQPSSMPAPGRMFVAGRVLDPAGKPVAGASVMVYARSPALRFGAANPAGERLYPHEIGRAASDGSGRFRADVPRTSSSLHVQFGAVALAPSYGVGWVELDPDADAPAADITLRPEQVIHGRLFDLQGQPARDVKLSVTAIRRVLPGPNRRRESFEGPAFWWIHPDDLPGWPGPTKSGADGRFTVHGAGPGLRVFLSALDPRFLGQVVEINTDTASTKAPPSFVLEPARTLSGRVTYADTGKPVAHALVRYSSRSQRFFPVGPRPVVTVSDSEGRFRAVVEPGIRVALVVEPPEGQPYVTNRQAVAWPKAAVTHSVDVTLNRGVMMRGKVTEQGSGRPVSGAIVTYVAHQAGLGLIRPVETAADGSFAVAVLPRPGYLTVMGSDPDYVLHGQDEGVIYAGQPRGVRTYAHAFLAGDPKPGSESQEVQVSLRRGLTVKGRVIGPNGEPVTNVWMVSRIHLGPRRFLLQEWLGSDHGIARNGQFELHGLDPDSEIPVSFFEPKRKLGATVRFSGKQSSGEPIVVKLEPCGTATARLVDAGGKPIAGPQGAALISMVVTPGEFTRLTAGKDGAMLADQAILRIVDPINYPTGPASDAQGRVVLPALIPGATYRVLTRATGRTPATRKLEFKDFIAKPGETLDFGDILIERLTPK